MAMNLIKKTNEYKIFKRGDERFAVQDATGKPVNGEEKVNILLAEELIKVTLPGAAPAEEASAEEASAEEASAEDEAPAETTDEEEATDAQTQGLCGKPAVAGFFVPKFAGAQSYKLCADRIFTTISLRN